MDSSQRSPERLVDLTGRIKRTCDYPEDGGGFGNIWRCILQDGEDQIVVAVKSLKSQDERELRRELGAWKRLRHANILPLLGIARGFGHSLSMVSRWMENGSLKTYFLKHKDITLSDRLRLLYDIASGLYYLHGVSVVHGDLTPNNVLVDDQKRAILTDFGLSSMLVDQGYSFSLRSCAKPGAIRYTAPEILDNSATIKPNIGSDVYSFGCLAFYVLSGTEPWPDIKSAYSIFGKINGGCRLQKPDEISDAHWSFIEWCLSPLGASTPPSRPSTVEILAFLKEALSLEGKKSSTSVFPSIVYSNGDEVIVPPQDNTSVTPRAPREINPADDPKRCVSPSYESPPVIRDKGKGPMMGSEKKLQFVPDLFRRKSDKKGTSSQQVTTKNSIIAANFLRIVQDSATPPGGLGKTFRCILRDKKMVAVKSIHVRNGDEMSTRTAQNIILIQARRWMSLQHQNVLPVCGTTTGFDSPLPCLVLPWMENGSLTSHLRNHKPSITEGRKLLSEVVAGLQYLHLNDIIHGSLSSNNVLIDDTRTIRLADYGLASVIFICSDLDQSNHHGALRWTAPELINSDEDQAPSSHSDIYSFGCVAFHVLSGRLPYWWLEDLFQVISARHESKDPLGSGLEMDERHDTFVRRCLSTSPSDRPVINEIETFVTG